MPEPTRPTTERACWLLLRLPSYGEAARHPQPLSAVERLIREGKLKRHYPVGCIGLGVRPAEDYPELLALFERLRVRPVPPGERIQLPPHLLQELREWAARYPAASTPPTSSSEEFAPTEILAGKKPLSSRRPEPNSTEILSTDELAARLASHRVSSKAPPLRTGTPADLPADIAADEAPTYVSSPAVQSPVSPDASTLSYEAPPVLSERPLNSRFAPKPKPQPVPMHRIRYPGENLFVRASRNGLRAGLLMLPLALIEAVIIARWLGSTAPLGGLLSLDAVLLVLRTLGWTMLLSHLVAVQTRLLGEVTWYWPRGLGSGAFLGFIAGLLLAGSWAAHSGMMSDFLIAAGIVWATVAGAVTGLFLSYQEAKDRPNPDLPIYYAVEWFDGRDLLRVGAVFGLIAVLATTEGLGLLQGPTIPADGANIRVGKLSVAEAVVRPVGSEGTHLLTAIFFNNSEDTLRSWQVDLELFDKSGQRLGVVIVENGRGRYEADGSETVQPTRPPVEAVVGIEARALRDAARERAERAFDVLDDPSGTKSAPTATPLQGSLFGMRQTSVVSPTAKPSPTPEVPDGGFLAPGQTMVFSFDLPEFASAPNQVASHIRFESNFDYANRDPSTRQFSVPGGY